MQNNNCAVKLENKKSVIRVVHNRENPFVQLNKQALWDQNLSLKAVGLWARCMSRPDNWEFNMTELIDKCKEGKDAIFKAMKEIIDAGYGMRIQYRLLENRKFLDGGIHYVFFEFPATEEEKLQQLEIFKKSFLHPDFQNAGNHDRGNPQLLIHILTEKESKAKILTPPIPPQNPEPKQPAIAVPGKAGERGLKNSSTEKSKAKRTPSEFSPITKELGEKLIAILTRNKSNYAPPQNLAPLLTHVDLLLRIDKRDPKLVEDVFSWAVADSFWSDKMYKKNPAEYLREKFDQLEMKMNAKPSKKERKFAPSSDDAESLRKMLEWEKTAL